jgi:hypothetical protein
LHKTRGIAPLNPNKKTSKTKTPYQRNQQLLVFNNVSGPSLMRKAYQHWVDYEEDIRNNPLTINGFTYSYQGGCPQYLTEPGEESMDSLVCHNCGLVASRVRLTEMNCTDCNVCIFLLLLCMCIQSFFLTFSCTKFQLNARINGLAMVKKIQMAIDSLSQPHKSLKPRSALHEEGFEIYDKRLVSLERGVVGKGHGYFEGMSYLCFSINTFDLKTGEIRFLSRFED